MYLTKKNLEKLINETKKIKLELKELIEKLSEARKLGDLSENSEYQTIKSKKFLLNKKLIEKENIINNCKIIEDLKIKDKTKITISAQIKLLNINKNTEKIYKLVDEAEIDPKLNLISTDSHIGKLLIGKSINDIITIERFNKINKFKILSIWYE